MWAQIQITVSLLLHHLFVTIIFLLLFVKDFKVNLNETCSLIFFPSSSINSKKKLKDLSAEEFFAHGLDSDISSGDEEDVMESAEVISPKENGGQEARYTVATAQGVLPDFQYRRGSMPLFFAGPLISSLMFRITH